MTDHPFDEIAVKAAVDGFNAYQGKTVGSGNLPNSLEAALTAACKSMKERGKARTIPNFVLLDGLKPDTATVTIFRHGE